MNTYQATNRKTRITAAALSIAIVAALLEVVSSGFVNPDPDSVSARQQVIAAQAEQVARARSFANGEVKSAAASAQPRI
jgi:hypothetical protein